MTLSHRRIKSAHRLRKDSKSVMQRKERNNEAHGKKSEGRLFAKEKKLLHRKGRFKLMRVRKKIN